MSHTSIYNPEKHIIETKVQGELAEDEADAIIAQITKLAVENNCFRIITDYREATLHLSTVALHKVPEKIEKAAALLGFHGARFKRAIVVSNDRKDFRFFETVTLNSGQNIKMFKDMDEARKWLYEGNK